MHPTYLYNAVDAGLDNSGITDNSARLTALVAEAATQATPTPLRFQLRLIRVESGTKNSDLFRFATLTWSVPVSVGFGRRLRYLVWDDGHQRLVGLIALGDPVFNLSVRDNLIEWNVHDRAKRLVSILDAYVLGAVPPYNMLLGGKAVAGLVRSKEIFDDFKKFYGNTTGIISGKRKRAQFARRYDYIQHGPFVCL